MVIAAVFLQRYAVPCMSKLTSADYVSFYQYFLGLDIFWLVSGLFFVFQWISLIKLGESVTGNKGRIMLLVSCLWGNLWNLFGLHFKWYTVCMCVIYICICAEDIAGLWDGWCQWHQFCFFSGLSGRKLDIIFKGRGLGSNLR